MKTKKPSKEELVDIMVNSGSNSPEYRKAYQKHIKLYGRLKNPKPDKQELERIIANSKAGSPEYMKAYGRLRYHYQNPNKPSKHRLIRIMEMYDSKTPEYQRAMHQYNNYYGRTFTKPKKEDLNRIMAESRYGSREYISARKKFVYWYKGGRDVQLKQRCERHKRKREELQDKIKRENEMIEKAIFQHIFRELTEIIKATA